jgi:hypothetical protein
VSKETDVNYVYRKLPSCRLHNHILADLLEVILPEKCELPQAEQTGLVQNCNYNRFANDVCMYLIFFCRPQFSISSLYRNLLILLTGISRTLHPIRNALCVSRLFSSLISLKCMLREGTESYRMSQIVVLESPSWEGFRSDLSNPAPLRPGRSRTREFSEPRVVNVLKQSFPATPFRPYGGRGSVSPTHS